jgi:hypothetical protein
MPANVAVAGDGHTPGGVSGSLRYFMSDGATQFGYKIFFGRKFPRTIQS